MDNEISTSVLGTVQLVVVAVIVGILVTFTAYTQEFKRQRVDAIADSQWVSTSSELRELRDYGAVPVPTLYAVLLKCKGDVIIKPVTIYENYVNETEDLTVPELLKEKVRIALVPVLDRFEVEIMED